MNEVFAFVLQTPMVYTQIRHAVTQLSSRSPPQSRLCVLCPFEFQGA